ncbi:MAG TPA: DNA ligase D [Burkholderiales bacterium]|nr:DNA ligase D [Burkholderiales bacterium]
MSDRLDRYREMRDFARTPEPSGRKRTAAGKELHYYIQRHAATRLHYDFRLELEGVLKSWAVPKGPSLDPHDRRLAVQTEDHPLEYGEFEGVIPEKQYGAGEVLLWDRGVWVAEDADPLAALRKGRLHFHLEGEKLRGSWTLARMRDEKNWLLIKRNDDEARAGYEVTEARPESVKRPPKRSSRAAKAELPQFIAPQLATLVKEPPQGRDWIYEVKHDGYRVLARFSDQKVALFTRSGKDWTEKMPHVARALEKLKLTDTWLDGEVVVLTAEGRSSFQALQNAFEAGRDSAMVYYVFDAPYLDGKDQTRLPLRERKKRLQKALKGKNGVIRFSEHLDAPASEALEQACKLGLEGLIGKETGSVYQAGRARTWVKLKCRPRQEFVIVGYTAPGGSRSHFGALLLGQYSETGKLEFAGKVGTGFDEDLLQQLMKKMRPLKRPDAPVVNPPREKGLQWIRPVLVAEIAFTEKTNEGILRQASFMGLRADKPAKTVKEEKAVDDNVVLGVKISHPERLVWKDEGISKLELARYVESVSAKLLHELKGRPLTLVRCPDGAGGQCFYQRHLAMGASPGEVKTFKRERSSKGYYIYVDTEPALVSLVQNGAIEMHTWGAALPDVRHPDRITLDLDPGPDLPWKKVLEATRLTRKLVESLGFGSFLKTTGGKGLHVVFPIARRNSWDEVKEFARLIAEFLVKAEPGLFVSTMAKQARGGKVFVDYLRNGETASAVAAYSPRARPGATVSTPIAWDELESEDLRARFTIKTVPERIALQRRDPWSGYEEARKPISAAMKRALGE